MGGGGGGSSSSSTSATTTTNTDKRLVVDHGVGVSSDSSTVNVTTTDLGAIQSAFDLTKVGLSGVSGSFDKVVGLVAAQAHDTGSGDDHESEVIGAAQELRSLLRPYV